jgi:hypothetical protein
MCHDLHTKWTCLIDSEVSGEAVGPAWGGSVYYERNNLLVRASLDTCSTVAVLDLSKLPQRQQLYTVSHDERYLIYSALVQDDPPGFNLVRIDLTDGSWTTLLDEVVTDRLGAQFNPARGYDYLVSMAVWENGVRHGVAFLTEADGSQRRPVLSHVHHSAWLGDTNRFAGLLMFDGERMAHFPENPDGELMIYSADGTPPRLIPAPEHIFYHISASICGRYVVCESLEGGFAGRPVPIVVVNVDSGKYRTIVGDCQCSPAGDDGRQAKPYFTADNRHVIYTADPDGVVNVFAAEIPAGFLESLD